VATPVRHCVCTQHDHGDRDRRVQRTRSPHRTKPWPAVHEVGVTQYVPRLPFSLDPLIAEAKRRARHRRLVVVALVVGLSGGAAGAAYLSQQRDGGPSVRVLVAKSFVQKGTTGDAIGGASLYQVVRIPRYKVEPGALLNPATLHGEAAVRDISGGQQLTAAQFGPCPICRRGMGGQIERAVVVNIGSQRSVGGQISADSRVDVWITTSGRARKRGTRPIPKRLFENMLVLGVDGRNVTLRAIARQAGRIIYASQNAQTRLVPRPVNHPTRVAAQNTFPG
jgi:Flp pilus assembly protein CpaB